MNRLAGISLLIGALSGMVSLLMASAPASARSYMQAFPRSRVAGSILAGIALSWSAVLLMRMNLGFLEEYKQLILVLAPLALILVVLFVDELLAPRALGGILLLVPVPLLESARWLDSAWRYFAVISAYLMVVKGISLVLNPYIFRKFSSFFLRTDSSVRCWGLTGFVYALIWIVLAFTVYR